MAAASRRLAPAPAAEAPAPEAEDTAPAVDVVAGSVVAGDDSSDTTVYAVVVNREKTYAVWPVAKGLPAGWTAVGPEGTKRTAWPTSAMSGPTCARSASGPRWVTDYRWMLAAA
jgi:hypothetical protein